MHVSANPAFGIATIWDADILIWATSRINQMREQGANDLPRTLRTTSYDLLKAIKRDTGGKGYKELQAALQRLEATTIQTSIRGSKRNTKAQFGWLDEWVMESDPETGAPRGLSLTLSNWVYEGVIKHRALLTLHPDYFALAGGVERAIYRIARKHAGDQPAGWTCRVSVLHDKTGARARSSSSTICSSASSRPTTCQNTTSASRAPPTTPRRFTSSDVTPPNAPPLRLTWSNSRPISPSPERGCPRPRS